MADLDRYGEDLAELVARTELLKRGLLPKRFDDRKDRRDIEFAERRIVAGAVRYCERFGAAEEVFQAAVDRVIDGAKEGGGP